MNSTFHETLYLDDETEVTVEFTQGQYYPATGPSWNDPGSPAEGGEIEIVGVTTVAGQVTPTEAEMQRFYNELYAMPVHVHEPDWDAINDARRDDAVHFAQYDDGGDF